MKYLCHYRHADLFARCFALVGAVLLCGAIATPAAFAASDDSKVVMGVEAWPGVTVKSEIAAEIMETLGYEVKQISAATPFILHGLSKGDIDVGLGGWYPISKSMIQPLVDKGKIVRLTANLPHALSGMAVPMYVHKAGVDSVEDLHRFGKRFDKTIHSIEPGSTWTTHVEEAIKADRYHLKGWKVRSSSTAAMLTEVKRAIRKKQWIVFYGWKPHWMNITYDLYYLTAPEKSPIVHTEATVYTLVKANFKKSHPNLTTFFQQYKMDTKTQSQWIYAYSQKKESPEKIAHAWIAANLKQVQKWLKGVTTQDGSKSAFKAVKAAYGE
jgi:glycine betaine/proline transport system substrate-binding protein